MKKKVIKERNLVSRKYTLNDISKWVRYGISLGIIKKGGSKEDVELMMKWIDMLSDSDFNV